MSFDKSIAVLSLPQVDGSNVFIRICIFLDRITHNVTDKMFMNWDYG